MKSYCRFLTGREAVESFFNIVMLSHNFNWLDDNLRRLIVFFDMANMILNQELIVIGGFDENNKLCGLQHGMKEDNIFHNHIFFTRHCKDAIAIGYEAIRMLKKEFPEITKMIGTIPEHNRAAKIYALKGGFRFTGIKEDVFFTQDGIQQKIMIFEKEI